MLFHSKMKSLLLLVMLWLLQLSFPTLVHSHSSLDRDCGLMNGFPISLRNRSQWLKELILLMYSPLHQILLSGTEKAYQLTEFLLKMLLLSFPVLGTHCWSIHNSRVRNGSRVKKVEIWSLFNLPRRHGLRKSKWLFQTEMSLWSNQSVKISTPF